MISNPSGQIFISYSHTDKEQMLVVRKHLAGMTYGSFRIWTDLDIPAGTIWVDHLSKNLNQASSALILASPDYLVSEWCRRELRILAEAHKNRGLQNVFWIQLRPCGWRTSELSQFQTVDGNTRQAISEYDRDTNRDRELLQLCEGIIARIGNSVTEQDRQVALIRHYLTRAQDVNQVTIERVLNTTGSFSICYLGKMGSITAVFKMLRWVPMPNMIDDLRQIARTRREVRHRSFIQMHDVINCDHEGDRQTILVSEFIGPSDKKLYDCIGNDIQSDNIDLIVRLIRRSAEAIAIVHQKYKSHGETPVRGEAAWTIGLLTSMHTYYDGTQQRLLIAPFSISGFFWHSLGWNEFKEWVDPSCKYYEPPEKADSLKITRQVDQFMLGLIAIELLEGVALKDILERNPSKRIWEEPRQFLRKTWPDTHPQLWKTVQRMIQRKPSDRWPDMGVVAKKLLGVEEDKRAIAKLSYMGDFTTNEGTRFCLNDTNFFRDLYKNLFNLSEKSMNRFLHSSSRDEFLQSSEQHDKLRYAMTFILNFREGNEPTSLHQVRNSHDERGVTDLEFDKFAEAFKKTLKEHCNDRRLQDAWEALLEPAIDYLKEKPH